MAWNFPTKPKKDSVTLVKMNKHNQTNPPQSQ